ncbi:MAG: Asp-tRNA(Asn)/Glu-tRNA(Gln) amidotransferase subunit GatA [Armatimonadetes bacterium]|nr:Asp-tRNA(Asn)/Glu-tRNA(Gln) amidotransferase subunit GatA [Armatimonadota bacterium]
MNSDLFRLSIPEARALLDSRQISAVELCQSCLDRIRSIDPQVKAYLLVNAESALSQASIADARLAAGETGPLLGIPIALKDNLCTTDADTTAGSKILEGYRPPYDATVVAKLREAGAVLIGKANCDEFAMGSSTENSGFFPTANPWDLTRAPGGSSGGSAAAAAADMALGALGSDTGGSIRQPAALCGVVGAKPTYGRVSRYGLIAYASSLDQIGPFGKTVEDCAILTEAICGLDAHDSTTFDAPPPKIVDTLHEGAKGLRLGAPKEFFGEGVNPQVVSAVRRAMDVLADAGAEIEETSLPYVEYGLPIYYILAPAEASSNLARFDGVRYGLREGFAEGHIGMMQRTRAKGFGEEVVQRIMIGTYALSAGYYDAYYLKAQQCRTLIRQDFDRAFEKYDALICPTSPTTAFKLGEFSDDPLALKLADVLTIPVNLAGLPGISVPCGLDEAGLPIGLQIIGKAFDEATMFRIAASYESRTDFRSLRRLL